MSAPISLEEVKKHKNDESCWVVIHDDVYDLTKFLSEHPGGAETILDVAGQDGTQDFEDVGHSADAREMMKKYKIGPLIAEKNTFTEESPDDVCSSHNARRRPSSGRWKWALLALGGAIVIGFVLSKYLKK